MEILIQADDTTLHEAPDTELRRRVRRWAQRLGVILRTMSVRVMESISDTGASERHCSIDARLDSGLHLSVHARGRAAWVALERALRRLARVIAQQSRRALQSRRLRALLAS